MDQNIPDNSLAKRLMKNFYQNRRSAEFQKRLRDLLRNKITPAEFPVGGRAAEEEEAKKGTGLYDEIQEKMESNSDANKYKVQSFQGSFASPKFIKPLGALGANKKTPEEEWETQQRMFELVPKKHKLFKDNSYSNSDFNKDSIDLDWGDDIEGTSNKFGGINKVQKGSNIYYKKPFTKAIQKPGVEDFNTFYDKNYPDFPKAFMKSGARYYPQVPGKNLKALLDEKEIQDATPYIEKANKQLLELSIKHPDPHSGNYFMDSSENVFPIDFSILKNKEL